MLMLIIHGGKRWLNADKYFMVKLYILQRLLQIKEPIVFPK